MDERTAALLRRAHEQRERAERLREQAREALARSADAMARLRQKLAETHDLLRRRGEGEREGRGALAEGPDQP